MIEARLEGLSGLEFLANASPDDYGVQVMKTIVAYILENAQKTARDKPNKPEERESPSPLGEDVRMAFAVLKRLYDRHKKRLIKAGKLHRWFSKSQKPDDLSFANADFRMLNLISIEWIDMVDLRRAKLQDAYLNGAQLQGADLQRADLRGTQLQVARLQGANLEGVYLYGADLLGADLQGADLQGARLQGANLNFAYLQGADLHMAQLHGADLRDAQLQRADFTNAQLYGANLQGARLQSADLKYEEG